MVKSNSNWIDLSSFNSENPLIILDLANNHNGSLIHGKKIIDEILSVTKNFNFSIAIKFQYRNLPSFIHPKFQDRRDLKYVERFLSSQLSWDNFIELRNYIEEAGFYSACTPFDEFSVGKVLEHKFDLLKIASASITDWPLLEAATTWSGPIIGSTAGVGYSEIDRVVSFLRNRTLKFALMHCVAEYPTPNDKLKLRRISELKMRYPGIPIGYSTHESPENMMAAPMALAAGAVILERHIGSASGGNQLNSYSSDKNNLNDWLKVIRDSIGMLKVTKEENTNEKSAITGLRRYAYSNKTIKSGEPINSEDIILAIPAEYPTQLQANDLGKYVSLVAKNDIEKFGPLTTDNLSITDTSEKLNEIRKDILTFIESTTIQIPKTNTLEISHHYGLADFYKFGLAMITLVNLSYCKKYLILLKGQKNPSHFHKQKDESFFVLHGKVHVKLDNQEVLLNEGEILHIQRGKTHEFWSETGCIIEELSTQHVSNDSFYIDNEINTSKLRKSFINYWTEI